MFKFGFKNDGHVAGTKRSGEWTRLTPDPKTWPKFGSMCMVRNVSGVGTLITIAQFKGATVTANGLSTEFTFPLHIYGSWLTGVDSDDIQTLFDVDYWRPVSPSDHPR